MSMGTWILWHNGYEEIVRGKYLGNTGTMDSPTVI